MVLHRVCTRRDRMWDRTV